MNRDYYYEDLLSISTGYFSSSAIKQICFEANIERHYQLNRFYICMSMGSCWKEERFPCKPTAKQIRKAIKELRQYRVSITNEFNPYCDADESGEIT